ncbi:undecaprenyl-phosphate glucose phosphotransferase [Chitinibacteraceae bacterium HSL-7]
MNSVTDSLAPVSAYSASEPLENVPKLAQVDQHFGLLSHAAPLASLCKSVIDPIVVVAVLYLLTIPFDVARDGPLLIWAALSFLLASQLLDGTFLFVPGLGRPLLGVGRLVISWGLILVSLYLLGQLSGLIQYMHPPFLLAWAIGAPVALVSVHALFRVALLKPYASSMPHKRAVIVGANHAGLALAQRIHENPELRIEFSGYFDDRTPERLGVDEEAILGRLSALAAYVKEHNIQQIYVSLPMSSQPRVLALLDDLKDSTVSIYFLPDFFVFDLIQARFDHVAGMPVVAVCESPFVGVAAITKRISDIMLSIVALLMLWPVLLAVALAVKFTSDGPVLFKQRRYGADGESILVYKFRSMTVMENGDKVTQATKNDQRLTPIGGFIRKTSLDELPQFINVLQGRMSIVGPRPHANAHNEMYRKLIPGYMIRHKVKPGITGWAQVNGYRGETETLDKMEKRIEFDLEYLRNWSIWLDLKIVFKTAMMFIVRDKNAY